MAFSGEFKNRLGDPRSAVGVSSLPRVVLPTPRTPLNNSRVVRLGKEAKSHGRESNKVIISFVQLVLQKILDDNVF